MTRPRTALNRGGMEAVDLQFKADFFEHPKLCIAQGAIGSGDIAGQRLGERRLRGATKGGKPGQQSQQCEKMPRHGLVQIVPEAARVHSLCLIYCARLRA